MGGLIEGLYIELDFWKMNENLLGELNQEGNPEGIIKVNAEIWKYILWSKQFGTLMAP